MGISARGGFAFGGKNPKPSPGIYGRRGNDLTMEAARVLAGRK